MWSVCGLCVVCVLSVCGLCLVFGQLTMMKKKEPLLQEFEEGPLDFQPTFKFDRLSDNYDSR